MKRQIVSFLVLVILSMIAGFSTYWYCALGEQRVPDFNAAPPLQKSLVVILFDDVSGSIEANGIEATPSHAYNSLFNIVDRDVYVYYGIISDSSGNKLVSLFLPKKAFAPPMVPDTKAGDLVQRKMQKEEYNRALAAYLKDSIEYYINRKLAIDRFAHATDSVLAIYQKKTEQTDLATALDVADNTLNTFRNIPSSKFIVLNSDGLDSYGLKSEKLENFAMVILCNAGKKQKTSIDSILTIKVTSPEDAIALISKQVNQ